LAIISFGQQIKSLNYTIAPWRDNKKAAASITLDDAILGQFTIAVPLLNKYNIPATFFITASIMQQQNITWQMVKNAAAQGHEIANHTLTHPHMHAIPVANMIYEVDSCNKLIDKNVPSQKCLTLAYPFGDGGNATDSEKIVLKVIEPYCIGARATRNNKLAYNAYSFATTNDEYYRVNCDVIADSAAMVDLPAHIDETIAGGGWYVPLYHGIETGWLITKKDVFEKHLQAFDKRKSEIWMTPFANALKYHKERNCATLKTVSEDNHTLVLSLTDTLSNASVWDEPLTINLNKPHLDVKSIVQGGHSVPSTKKEGTITFNATPGSEKIIITKAK